jgi:hypothetical protein
MAKQYNRDLAIQSNTKVCMYNLDIAFQLPHSSTILAQDDKKSSSAQTWCLDVMSTPRLEHCNYDPNVATSEGYDSKTVQHVTLRPKSGRIVRPLEIVTLQPQKEGRGVTVEHCVPLVILAPTVCDSVPDSTALPWHFCTDFGLLALFFNYWHF